MDSAPETSVKANSASQASERPRVSTTGDLGALSKKAGHELFVEFSASAQNTRAASSAAWNWLRLGAEKRLGLEVSIEDPALRELFGHLLQVETLLGQVRDNADSLAR